MKNVVEFGGYKETGPILICSVVRKEVSCKLSVMVRDRRQ
jgi:hypothetical protein